MLALHTAPSHSHAARPQDLGLEWLPLVTLYLSERCNSRCVTCDYWRHGRIDADLRSIERLLPSLARLRTQAALLSGGEPLLHRHWADIALALRDHGLGVWLLTSGLSLVKHAPRAAKLFDQITVSLDGTTPPSYAAIRGVAAFDRVCQGIRAAAGAGAAVTLRVTLQRANFRELPRFVDLAGELGARGVSFLAVDSAHASAFGRMGAPPAQLAPRAEELPELEHLLDELECTHAAAFRSGFIAESPQKLRRIGQYFAAVHGLRPYPPVHCNAPEFSAVVTASGRLQPCFFIEGPRGASVGEDLGRALDEPAQRALRAAIRAGERPECRTCVCSMWRDLSAQSARAGLLPQLLRTGAGP